MILSRNWLEEFVSVQVKDRAFARAMTLSGSKVEVIGYPGLEIRNVVVGRVASMERHPDSDHMWICQVEIGNGDALSVVTGAQNVRVGHLVPTALDNADLPGGVHITAGTLRGVESKGMLCSLQELGLTTHDCPYAVTDGIFILSDDPDLKHAVPGTDIRTVLGLDDRIVEFEITPNRPDCLSIIGLAREAAVTFGKPLKLHTPKVKAEGEGDLMALLDVETPDPDLCTRYTARMVRNVTIGPSPKWMRERLRSSGVRPINNIVDITNYVMLEYGQPMHAFDYRYVKGGKIIVRRAQEGEALTTLDGTVRKLTREMLVIADEHRAVGLAGIMGGENSEIVADTVDVVFESANFNGTAIRKAALSLGMRTEASAKFEKGLDPMNTLPAVERACELVELLGAGQVVEGCIDILNAIPQPTVLKLRADRINALLGTDIAVEEMTAILRALEFTVDGEDVTVPSWRGDVTHYSDLAEEVARFHGYDKIPTTFMRGEITLGSYSSAEEAERDLGLTCRSLGYSEIITYSFLSPACYDKIRLPQNSSLRQSMKIRNPLGEDTSIMRTTLLPSMLEILARNYSVRNKSVRLYEIGRAYFARPDGQADEPKTLVLGAYGSLDFFTLKGAVEGILASLRIPHADYESITYNLSYHPGRCACVRVNGKELGVLGQIHPMVCRSYGVEDALYCAELSLDALLEARGPEALYTPLPRFPSVTRDIAVVCDAGVTVAALEDCIQRGAKGLIQNIELFDVYTGTPIPAGKKSVAFNLTLRADDRSLTAAEADEDIKSVLSLLEKEQNAVLRG